ncbi:MAG: hypothetical protein EHM19_13250 [Candidatus Latescibacterota bacterium]|nr:MAG: hypothetical protein EHM19_13250 [Candidatus Latescibacterota bacterium]
MNPRFRIVRVHGPYPLVHGFIAGFLAGKGLAGRVFYAEKERIEAEIDPEEGLAEKLAEWIGFQKFLSTDVVLEESIHGPVLDALKGTKDLHLEIEASRAVAEASFEVRLRTYSEEEAGTIRKLLREVPEGVRALPGLELEEKRVKGAAGIEAYAPEHEFELEGSGSFAGPVDRIIELRKRLSDNALIHCGPIRLKLE